MKIVDGKPFEYQFACRACKSELIAEADDIQIGYFGPNYGGETPERRYYVTCPVCGTDHVLPFTPPPNVRHAADRKGKK